MSGAKAKQQPRLEQILAAELFYLASDLHKEDGRAAYLLRSRALEIEGSESGMAGGASRLPVHQVESSRRGERLH